MKLNDRNKKKWTKILKYIYKLFKKKLKTTLKMNNNSRSKFFQKTKIKLKDNFNLKKK